MLFCNLMRRPHIGRLFKFYSLLKIQMEVFMLKKGSHFGSETKAKGCLTYVFEWLVTS